MPQFNFGHAPLKRFALIRLGKLSLTPVRCSFMSHTEPIKWLLKWDIEWIQNNNLISLPFQMYVYNPWHLVLGKLNLWKLKIFWDWHFSETLFVDHSKEAMVVITKLIRKQSDKHIKRCATPMGYKQIMHDFVNPKTVNDWPNKLLRFEKRHIRRAILLQIQQLPQYGHKFAFVDVIFLACRRTNDFKTTSETQEIHDLIDTLVETRKLLVPYPIVFAEFFVRFRRDYSVSPTHLTGQWLVSTYKIFKLDILNYHPEFYVGRQYCAKIFRSCKI